MDQNGKFRQNSSPRDWASGNKCPAGHTASSNMMGNRHDWQRSSKGHTRDYPERVSSNLMEYTDYALARSEAQDHFNKKFTFKPSQNKPWLLPCSQDMFSSPLWQDESLQKMKSLLNATKLLVSDKEPGCWHQHTNNVNLANRIHYAVRKRSHGELVTQAWLKFWEIVNGYPIVPTQVHFFNSLHLCEAPGAFITSLNHYLFMERPFVKWQWFANTLNPYHEGTPLDRCIADDRLILVTPDRWCYGVNDTGDITESENVDDISTVTKRLEEQVHLVTADGSVNCQGDPGEQELTTMMLHRCEVMTALRVLSKCGSFVLKIFTCFEGETVNLLYLLCCAFRCVEVFKPGTSKQGNSEVYLVCLDYVGMEVMGSYLERLGTWQKEKENGKESGVSKAMFCRANIPDDFFSQLRECVQVFKNHQEKSISRNLALFSSMSEKEKQYNFLVQSQCMEVFFELNPCLEIPHNRTITNGADGQPRILSADWLKSWGANLAKAGTLKKELVCRYLQDFTERFNNRFTENDMECGTYRLCQFIVPQKLKYLCRKGKAFTSVESCKFASETAFRLFKVLSSMVATVDQNKVVKMLDSVLKSSEEITASALIIQEPSATRDSSSCNALQGLVSSLQKGGIAIGQSVVLLNVQLLTRFQMGLVLALGSVFETCEVRVSESVGTLAPVVILRNLRSDKKGCENQMKELLGFISETSQLLAKDNSEMGILGEANQQILQLFPLSFLMDHRWLNAFYLYNSHYCVYQSFDLLKNC